MSIAAALIGLAPLWLGVPPEAEPVLPGARPDLSGNWARVRVLRTVTDIPFVGEVVNTQRSLSIVTFQADAGAFRQVEKVCAVKLSSTTDRIKTRLSEGFVTALSGRSASAKVVRRGAVWRFEQPSTAQVFGAKLQAPASEGLPSTAADSRVTDGDRDGHPGLTVRVTGLANGDIHLVQREWTTLSGRVSKDQRSIRGRLTWRGEQRVLSATSPLLKKPLPERQHTDRARSYFKMVRIPTNWSCAKLSRQAKTLF